VAGRLTSNVEAVEKVLKRILWQDAGKNDLTGYAIINDLMIRRGQATPENQPVLPLRGLFYRLVMCNEKNLEG
jgi:hypothetical protein